MTGITITGATVFDGVDVLAGTPAVRAVDGVIVGVGDVEPESGDVIIEVDPLQ